jgi:hypothetical protein
MFLNNEFNIFIYSIQNAKYSNERNINVSHLGILKEMKRTIYVLQLKF